MEQIFVSVREACAMTTLGKTKLYELLRVGRIQSTRVGTRRLILLSSISELSPKIFDALSELEAGSTAS